MQRRAREGGRSERGWRPDRVRGERGMREKGTETDDKERRWHCCGAIPPTIYLFGIVLLVF